MHGMIIQKVALGALGASSSLILAKSLKRIMTLAPAHGLKGMTTLAPAHGPYMTTRRAALAFGREIEYMWGALQGSPASSNLRVEALCSGQALCRRFSSYHELQVKEALRITKALKKGEVHDFLSRPAIKFNLYYGKAWGQPPQPGLYGLASISAVLNALEGFCRLFSDFILDSCDSLEKIKDEGLSFGKLAFLAFCNGAKVEVCRENQCTIEDFRKHVVQCATSEDKYMVVFFDRTHFKQIGGNHLSPIAGYHAGKDLVFILDVSRFVEYSPFWIPLELLWKALKGFMVLSRLPKDPCILYTLSCRDESWINTANYLRQVPDLLKAEDVKDVEQVLSVVFASLPSNFSNFITRVSYPRTPKLEGRPIPLEVKREMLVVQEQLLRQVKATELYKHVSEWLRSEKSYSLIGNKEVLSAESSGPIVTSFSTPSYSSSYSVGVTDNDALTMLLFALPYHTWSNSISKAEASSKFESLVSIENAPDLIHDEVVSLRQQLEFLMMDLDSDPNPIFKRIGPVEPDYVNPLWRGRKIKSNSELSFLIDQKKKWPFSPVEAKNTKE